MSRQANILMSFLLGLFGTAIVLVLGLFAYKYFTDETTLQKQINGDSTVVESFNYLGGTNRTNVESASARTLEELYQIRSDYARAVTLRSMLATADELRLLELIEQSKELSSKDRRLFVQNQIFRRFAALDPTRALAQASEFPQNERGTLVSAVFREWVVADPNAAIQQAKKLDNLDQRIALETILQFKDDMDYDQLADISIDMGHKDIGEKFLERFAIEKSVVDPKRALVTVLSDSVRNDFQTPSIVAIAENWFDRGGEDALLQMHELAQVFSIPPPIPYSVFQELVRSNPSSAFELAKRLSSNLGDSPLRFAIGAWASVDPHTALQALSSIDSEQLRAKLQIFLGLSWERNDPQAVLNNLPLFLPSVREDIQRSAIHALARKTPREAAEMMLEISEHPFHNEVERLVREWSESNVREALDWVLNQNKILPSNLLSSLWRELAIEDPELALKTALGQPLNLNTGDERYVIRELANVDIEKAIALLPQVREELGTKYFSYAEVGLALVKREDPARALELGEDLAESMRQDYYSLLLSMWSDADQIGLFEKLHEFPSQELKSTAARMLLTDGERYRYFSQDQRTMLESQLTGEDVTWYEEHENRN